MCDKECPLFSDLILAVFNILIALLYIVDRLSNVTFSMLCDKQHDKAKHNIKSITIVALTLSNPQKADNVTVVAVSLFAFAYKQLSVYYLLKRYVTIIVM